MSRMRWMTVIVGHCLLATVLCQAAAVNGLRCEYLDNPRGIDVPQPRLSWIIQSEQRGEAQSGYRLLVASTPQGLAGDQGDLWDSGEVKSDQSVHVVYAGQPLRSGQRCYWKVKVWDQTGKASAWSDPTLWSMGLLDEKDWQGEWIGAENGPPARKRHYFRNGDPKDAPAITPGMAPALLLRREADLPKRPLRATAYVCGLGYFELYVNGTRVGDHVLDPIFTDYSRRVCYVTHDVTALLREGPNALGVILGNGFYNTPSPDLFQFEKADWKSPPRLRLDLVLEYDDGSTRRIISDGEWKWRTGPIVYNSIRGGESIDSRIEVGAWLEPRFDDSVEWSPVVKVTRSAAVMTAQMAPPMRGSQTLPPVAITEPKPGVWIADFGKNMTGWARFETRGEAGQKVQLDYNEALTKDGTLELGYSAGHTYGRFQRDELVLSGHAVDVLEPRFTYHGFRYVQVTGLGGHKLTPELIQAKLVHTDLPETGGFECSNQRLNQLHAAVRRTLLDSVHGMPGEEPTREKMGWTQDGQNTMESYVYNFDSQAIYQKYIQDMIDAQEANGHVPPIIPTQGWGYLSDTGEFEFCDDPWWGGTLAVVVDHLYTYYADRKTLEHAYEPMRRYVDWMGDTATDCIVSWQLGDWLELQHGKNRLTSVPLTSTAGYFHLANLLAKHAAILGKAEDATKYAKLADTIRQAYNAKFLDADGWYQRDSQTAQALSLFLGLVPAERVKQVKANLAADLERRGRHLTTGFIGLMPTMYELSRDGRLDLAYAAATQEKGSSWLHMVKDENSTLGENIHPEGYGSNHHPFGACIGAWLYKDLAGIQPDPAGPGFKKIIVRPGIAGDLTWVKAHHDSVHGRIEVAWKREGDQVTLDVTIPGNTTATVYVPAKSVGAVTEGGKPAAEAEGLEFARMENGAAVFAVAAGRYHFVSPNALALRKEPLTIDLAQAVRPVETVNLGQGTQADPKGHTVTADSRSFLLDGKPWVPIAGEFHYARYPRSDWRDELLKMKAGGINTVSSYVFWIHHEEIRGEFDWSDRRSLRDFLKLCDEVGLKAIVRMGPWCNGEVRNGGFPDWVQNSRTKLRTIDPAYVELVKPLYQQIAAQMKGLLWKDGGPVIGVQVDNECGNLDYLLELKKLARSNGVDVPFYVMTGWNGVSIPKSDLIPLFGAYAAGFWDGSLETYRNFFVYSGIRDNGDMGAQFVNLHPDRSGNIDRFPYGCIEIGGGMQSSDGRRIHIDPQDIAAMAWVKLGCGNTMPGYYMYHGGINPDGKRSYLNSVNDSNALPVKDYDFQAPLGACGEVRQQYHLLRQQHLFLEDFGPALVRMPAMFPDQRPADINDFSVLRWDVRSNGNAGFLFFNNRQPTIPLPDHHGVQFTLRTKAGQSIVVPRQPITVPSGSYGVWPINLDCDGIPLEYATAQPLCRLTEDNAVWYFFAAIDGIEPELLFRKSAGKIAVDSGQQETSDEHVRIHGLMVGPKRAVAWTKPDGSSVNFVVLSTEQALHLWRLPLAGRERLILSDGTVLADGGDLRLQATNPHDLSFACFPSLPDVTARESTPDQTSEGIFTRYRIKSSIDSTPIKVTVEMIHPATATGDLNGANEKAWAHAAEWKLNIPASAAGRRVMLSIDYVADAIRLYNGDALLADNYYNGNVFKFGLWRIPADQWTALRVKLLPFSSKVPDRLPADVRVKISDETSPPRNQVAVAAEELLEARIRLAAQ